MFFPLMKGHSAYVGVRVMLGVGSSIDILLSMNLTIEQNLHIDYEETRIKQICILYRIHIYVVNIGIRSPFIEPLSSFLLSFFPSCSPHLFSSFLFSSLLFLSSFSLFLLPFLLFSHFLPFSLTHSPYLAFSHYFSISLPYLLSFLSYFFLPFIFPFISFFLFLLFIQ